MTDFIALPTALFEATEYRTLPPINRDFLHQLYHMFSDCECFTAEDGIFRQFGYKLEPSQYRKLNILIESGLIQITGHVDEKRPGPKTRIFQFKYPALDAFS
ncbi:MAG TPA: hypothetical protein VEC35_01235 [Noviherbaspirillum sp.]|nr:hypothetical protein [Noviherbaspirillum sp.]